MTDRGEALARALEEAKQLIRDHTYGSGDQGTKVTIHFEDLAQAVAAALAAPSGRADFEAGWNAAVESCPNHPTILPGVSVLHVATAPSPPETPEASMSSVRVAPPGGVREAIQAAVEALEQAADRLPTFDVQGRALYWLHDHIEQAVRGLDTCLSTLASAPASASPTSGDPGVPLGVGERQRSECASCHKAPTDDYSLALVRMNVKGIPGVFLCQWCRPRQEQEEASPQPGRDGTIPQGGDAQSDTRKAVSATSVAPAFNAASSSSAPGGEAIVKALRDDLHLMRRCSMATDDPLWTAMDGRIDALLAQLRAPAPRERAAGVDPREAMEPLVSKAYRDDEGDIVIEAVGGAWEGCVSHGSTLAEAFANFGEAAALYDEVAREIRAPAQPEGLRPDPRPRADDTRGG